MEWEVLDIVGKTNNADDQLNKWVHEQGQVANLGVSQGKHPKLKTVVELPTVDILEGILSKIISNCSQVKT